jgi:hypothetical protein
MKKSESIEQIAKALITFHVKCDTIKKDAKNPFFKSTYASLTNILDAINEPLIECGLSISQFPTGTDGLTTILMHQSGEYIAGEYSMRPAKDDPQGRGSAITYQRRYAIASVLSLNIDEDDDGNAATHGKSTPDQDNREWLNKDTENFLKVIAYLNGGGQISEVEKKYKLSKDIKQSLTNLKK